MLLLKLILVVALLCSVTVISTLSEVCIAPLLSINWIGAFLHTQISVRALMSVPVLIWALLSIHILVGAILSIHVLIGTLQNV